MCRSGIWEFSLVADRAFVAPIVASVRKLSKRSNRVLVRLVMLAMSCHVLTTFWFGEVKIGDGGSWWVLWRS